MLTEMKKSLSVMLLGVASVALIAGCSTGDPNSSNGINAGPGGNPNGGGGGDGGTGGECTTEQILDGAQCTVTDLTDDLASVLAGTPLEGVVQCVDPTANDLLDGPDSLVQALLNALANQDADPAAFQAAAEDLQAALESAGTNVPNVLLALSGDQNAIDACTGEGNPDGDDTGGDGSPLDPTALCAIPTIGEQIVSAAGGSCTGEGGTGGSPLDPAALCAVPGIGPVLAEGAGATCEGGGGGDSPLDASQLCAIPGIGAQLAEAAGSSCAGGGGDTGGGLCIPGDPTGQLCAEQLCAIPTLGPAIVEGAGSSCTPTAGGGSPIPLESLCAIPTLGAAIVEGAGSSCGPAGDGAGESPLDPAALCAVPGIGEPLASAAGADCGGGGAGGGEGICLPGDPTGMLCAEALCAVPELGPLLVEGVGGSCGVGGGDGGGDGPTGTPLDAVLGPVLDALGGGGGLPALCAPAEIPGIGGHCLPI